MGWFVLTPTRKSSPQPLRPLPRSSCAPPFADNCGAETQRAGFVGSIESCVASVTFEAPTADRNCDSLATFFLRIGAATGRQLRLHKRALHKACRAPGLIPDLGRSPTRLHLVPSDQDARS